MFVHEGECANTAGIHVPHSGEVHDQHWRLVEAEGTERCLEPGSVSVIGIPSKFENHRVVLAEHAKRQHLSTKHLFSWSIW
jgi:hypothetical protein